MIQPWYAKPIRALLLGVTAGLAISFLILELPQPWGEIAFVVGLACVLGYCFWALGDLKRESAKAKQAIVDYEKIYGRFES